MLELQKRILLFFSEHHTPAMNFIAGNLTQLGQDLVPIAIAFFVFWCIDKRKGFIIGLTQMIALNLMSLIKAIVRFPRPWKLIRGLEVLEKSGATGYSFPSGHTTIASAFYSSTALVMKKRIISIICALIIVIVAFTRIYLCVHWPMDVIGGLLIGIGTTLFIVPIVDRMFDNRHIIIHTIPIIGSACFVCALVMGILIQMDFIDYMAYSDFSKSLAICSTLLIGIGLEEKYIGFSTSGSVIKKAARYIIGLLVSLIILAVLKKILPYTPVMSVLRYGLLGMWATLIWPWIGCRTGLFEKT